MFKANGLILFCLGLILVGQCVQAQRPMGTKGKLIFADEFNTFNRSTWQPMITSWRGGQNQFQYYCNSTNNSWVANGMLNIKPTLTSDRFGAAFLYNGTLDLTKEGCNYGYAETGLNSSCYRKASSQDIINPVQSARLRTSSFGFTYGFVEARVKLSKGDWFWPSIFMMPVNNTYGTWPASGEIDLFEIRGNDNLTCDGLQIGNKRAKSTLHWGTDVNKDKSGKTGWNTTVLTTGSYADQFHVFTVEWTKTGIYYYVDNVYIGGVTPPNPGGFWKLGGFTNATNIWANGTNPLMTPFDHKFYIIVKLAVGGDYFPEGCINAGYQKPWNKDISTNQMRSFWEARNSWMPTWNRKANDSTMMVDYIRVYALP